MTLYNLIKFELMWRLREPLTLCFIMSPIFILAMAVLNLFPEGLVNFYVYYFSTSEAYFYIIMQISSIMWLILIVSVIAKNYNDKMLFFYLPVSRIQLWTAKVISLYMISACYFVNLILVMHIVNMVSANKIEISSLNVFLSTLSSGGVLVMLLTLSAHIRNRFIFMSLSFFLIIAPTLVKSVSKYFIGNFTRLIFFDSASMPESIVFFFKYCLPVYYIVFFFIGYLRYQNMKISHEI